VPALPVLLTTFRPASSRRRELALLAALALPVLGIMPFIHPAQGMFRDWDDFVAAGVALALATAWLVGETLRAAPRWAWLGVAASLGSAMPALQWMLHHHETRSGMQRMSAFVNEAPLRTEGERVAALDFLGNRHLHLGEDVESAEAFRRIVELAPSPRFLLQWAYVETKRGNYRTAFMAWQRLLEKTPDDLPAWRGYTLVASRLRMWPEAKRGATELLKRAPSDPEAIRLLEGIERSEAGLPPAPSQ